MFGLYLTSIFSCSQIVLVLNSELSAQYAFYFSHYVYRHTPKKGLQCLTKLHRMQQNKKS